MKKTVLSGIRATGKLHLGNYLGAVKGMLELQNNPEYETLYCVVDLHATTTPYDPKTLPSNTRSVILDYLACGINPEKSALYVQSDLSDLISQLAFYFSTSVTVARMQHLPTFKEKVKQHPENVTMALLNYPILMAADILIYKAGLVPVGIDQEPHLEVAREIARKMNETYGTKFPEPVRFATSGEYVPSLAGEGKMSKSVEGSYISLTDSLNEIKKKLAGAPTDSGSGGLVITNTNDNMIDQVISNDIKDEELLKQLKEKSGFPIYFDKQTNTYSQGVKNLLKLVELFEGVDKRKFYDDQYPSGIRYGDLKKDLAEAIFKELKPIQEKRKELEHKTTYVDEVIKNGAEKARKIASETILEVKEKMGLV